MDGDQAGPDQPQAAQPLERPHAVLGERIGSIEAGKRADLVAVALRAPELAPCYDPVSHLVYAAGREHVSHVWVDGELRVRDGELKNRAVFAPSNLDTRWQIWQNALESHADS